MLLHVFGKIEKAVKNMQKSRFKGAKTVEKTIAVCYYI